MCVFCACVPTLSYSLLSFFILVYFFKLLPSLHSHITATKSKYTQFCDSELVGLSVFSVRVCVCIVYSSTSSSPSSSSSSRFEVLNCVYNRTHCIFSVIEHINVHLCWITCSFYPHTHPFSGILTDSSICSVCLFASHRTVSSCVHSIEKKNIWRRRRRTKTTTAKQNKAKLLPFH